MVWYIVYSTRVYFLEKWSDNGGAGTKRDKFITNSTLVGDGAFSIVLEIISIKNISTLITKILITLM